jgi:amidohydrolase/hippurate hydrolase
MSQAFTIPEDIRQRMQHWRHAIHAHPETAFEEHNTAELVAQALSSAGIEIERGLAGTGVVGTLHNGEGPVIALRADLDALPIQELGKPGHVSTCQGKMHACGHDGHTAMLLGAAAYLARERNFSGTVHFIFQPAEENEGGARVMVEQGLFERFPVSAIYGMHNFPDLPRGRFGICVGTIMASFDTFEIVITGKGSHAAMPDKGIDPVVISAQLVLALQTIVSRRMSATESAVVSVTQIHAGDTWNVIPETLVLRGTVRTLAADVQARVEAQMHTICGGIAQTTGATVKLDYRHGYPCTVNAPAQTAAAIAAAASVVGEANVETAVQPSMGAEDFAFMLERCPGAYIKVGSAESKEDPPLHNPYYDFNDNVLPIGAAYWVALVAQQLPKNRG